MAHALAEGLNVILCVGEKLEEREAKKTDDVIYKQMESIVGNDASFKSFQHGSPETRAISRVYVVSFDTNMKFALKDCSLSLGLGWERL